MSVAPNSNQDRQWERLVRFAEIEVTRIQGSLDVSLSDLARAVPVSYEPVPNEQVVRDGIPADTLGLFVGASYQESEAVAHSLPAQIILFLENLWRFCRGDMVDYREEVARTYLHELGHYLGLNEDQLVDRDLD